MRLALVASVIASLVAIPSLALAANDCPPGGWFCEEGEAPTEEPAAPPEDPIPAEPEKPETTKPAEPEKPPEAAPKSDRIVVAPGEEPKERVVVVRKRARRERPEWGVNLRLISALMGSEKNPEASMGGAGFGLRYRPDPHFSFDFGLDFVGGTDFQGKQRSETAFTTNGLIFFNPKDLLQVYTLAGFGLSGARVEGAASSYGYFGAQLGIGVEARLARSVAVGVDVLGFVRGRTDDRSAYEPEFVDPATQRTTNSSGGGLMRAGLTFYW